MLSKRPIIFLLFIKNITPNSKIITAIRAYRKEGFVRKLIIIPIKATVIT